MPFALRFSLSLLLFALFSHFKCHTDFFCLSESAVAVFRSFTLTSDVLLGAGKTSTHFQLNSNSGVGGDSNNKYTISRVKSSLFEFVKVKFDVRNSGHLLVFRCVQGIEYDGVYGQLRHNYN